MLKKLDFTDRHLSAICSAAEFLAIAVFSVAAGIMYGTYTFSVGPASAAAVSIVGYFLSYWIHTGADDRLVSIEDYNDGFNAARRKLIEAGWRQAAAPERVESVLPADLMADADALIIDHEEAARSHQAAADRVRTITRGLAGVNFYTSELKVQLAQAEVRATRAEDALAAIRDVHTRYSYAPLSQPPTEEIVAQPVADILISPPDDGKPIPGFLTEPREIPLDERTTAHALARMAAMLNSTSLPAHAGT